MDDRKRILICDDDDIIRMLLVDTLENPEWVVEEAIDGQEALEKLNNQNFDLVVIDYMMPYYTGINVIEKLPLRIKENLSVIMLTAKSQKEDKDLATASGVTHFIQKPFSPSALYQLITSIFTK